MTSKRKGFSLAELLIALLVISIVLAAAIPTVSKRNNDRESVWHWAGSNNAYFGLGSGQSALIGINSLPKIAEGDEGNLKLFSSASHVEGLSLGSADTMRISNYGDKLVLLKQSLDGNVNTNMMNSHISFYNLKNGDVASQISYGGRLALDTHNIALGIGTLLSLADLTDGEDGFQGYNTALGHYALSSDNSGQFNTAIGERSLNNVVSSDFNTALGFESGFLIGIDKNETADNSGGNTAIGAQALRNTRNSRFNTAVGTNAMLSVINSINSVAIGANALVGGSYDYAKDSQQDANTAVGANALGHSLGSGNTALGASACNVLVGGHNNICIGYNAGNYFDGNWTKDSSGNTVYSYDMSNGLFITSTTGADDSDKHPLIYGRTQKDTTSAEAGREVGILADVFKVGSPDYPDYFKIETKPESAKQYNYYDFYTYKNSDAEYDSLRIFGNGQNNGLVHESNDNGIVNMNVVSQNTNPQLNMLLNGQKVMSFALDTDGKTPVLKLPSTSGIKIPNSTGSGYILISGDESGKISWVKGSGEVTAWVSASDAYFENMKGAGFTSEATGLLSTLLFEHQSKIQGNEESIGTINEEKIPELERKIESINACTCSASDIRLKDIISDAKEGLNEILSLQVKKYTYKNDKDKIEHIGVIAQDLQKIFPNSVFEDSDGYLKIKTDEIVFSLVNSVKEIYALIQDLTAKIAGLDKRIENLEKQNELLIKQNEEIQKQNKLLQKQNKEFEKRFDKLEKRLSKI